MEVDAMARGHTQQSEELYQKALLALNELQFAWKADLPREERFQLMKTNAERVGLSQDEMDKLNIIHISGTKGKGSTCAFTESLLRHHGYRTGFNSSPHLVDIRERIRINGSPISKDLFATYFWEMYDRFTQTAPLYKGEMPSYFTFLTYLAFHAFIRENVDVAVIEVGIGGQYDCTNIVRRPIVCGVTSLGLEHTDVLGDTIEEIAWNKAGIFKRGVPAVTLEQDLSALDVLRNRSLEVGCPLYLSPEYHDLDLWRDSNFRLGIPGRLQEKNSSLALQLARIWLQHKKSPLENCRWKGRLQTLRKAGVTYYLDGAHVKESLEQCVEWFMAESSEEERQIGAKVVKILIFNVPGKRDIFSMLSKLKGCNFDHAVFVPNILYTESYAQGSENAAVMKEKQLDGCRRNKAIWDGLFSECSVCENPEETLREGGPCELSSSFVVNNVTCNRKPASIPSVLMPSIHDAVYWSTQGKDPALSSADFFAPIPEQLQSANHIQILVTGVLQLVGGVLNLVEK